MSDQPTGAKRYGTGGGDAYYDAVRFGGYEGTREQFGKDQAEFAKNASAVAEAKETVVAAEQHVVQIEETFTNETVPAATEAIENKGTEQVQLVGEKGDEAAQAIVVVGNEQTERVTHEGDTQVARVQGAGSDSTDAIDQAKTAAVEDIEQAGETQVGFVNAAGTTNVGDVETAGTAQVAAVNSAGQTQVDSVNSAGAVQVQAVQQKGEEVLASIPEDYTELDQDVDNLKSAFNADLVPTSWPPNITKGSYYKVADGATSSSNKYARTSALWSGYGTRKAITVNDPTYEFCLTLYDETGTTSGTGYLGYIGYVTGTLYIPQNAKLFGISFRRADNTTLADSDITAISAALSALAATDTTLSVAGASADAKATGDMLNTAILEKDILPANTDLNTFTDIGLYRVPSGDSVLPTLVNYPSEKPGRLLVLTDENGYYCTQVVITSENVIYTRVQTSASNHTWTDWASYDHTTFRRRTGVKNEDDQWDANLILTNGNYNFNNAKVSQSANLPSPYAGQLIVFAATGATGNAFQIYVNRYGTIYYRTKYAEDQFSEWIRPLKADTTLSISGAAADAKTVGDAVRSGYVHDGDILRMLTTPEAIPVNENHMGYNEFISSTWDTLLPTGYQEGDAYNASTTKIHGVKVERASSWTSTPYGTNVDTYTIYRYIFTPQNGYDKTLFLTSGCHGNEAEGYWSLYRLVRMIYFEGHKYPTLRNLRDCRLIIIPSWNPWGFQHYRRYNAFEAKSYQAWAWLMSSNHQVTVNGTVYDISQVGEANVIWQTLQDYGDSINLWLDFHTDPYAGRDTSNVDIDDPRGVTPPYGCYGFSAKDSRGYRQLFSVMYDFYNILEDEYQFTETWHPQATNPGGSSFTGWMAQFGFPGGIVEISTFMDNFPYPSGSAGMMKLAQEYYGNCITEMLR